MIKEKKINIPESQEQAQQNRDINLTDVMLRLSCIEELLIKKEIISKEEYADAIDAAALKLLDKIKQIMSDEESFKKANDFLGGNIKNNKILN